MGKNFSAFSAIVPQPPLDQMQKGVQGMKTLMAVNSMPSAPGPAQPTPQALAMPTSLDDATRRVQDAFKAARVMKAINDGNNSQVLSTLKGRQ